MSDLIQLALTATGAGAIGGVLAGLMGVGGGIVIVPALYLMLSSFGVEPGLAMQLAVGTSLTTIIFTALSSASGHARRGAIDWALLRGWAGPIVLGVIVGAVLGGRVSGRILVAVFATVAALVAVDMLLRSPNPQRPPRQATRGLWAGMGVAAGAISAMMGIGGGTVCVPILSFLGYDIRRAIGTSAAIGLIIALPGTVVYAASGLGVAGRPPGSLGFVSLPAALVIIPVSMLCARIGVRLAHRIAPWALRRLFGLFLALTALRMARDLIQAAG